MNEIEAFVGSAHGGVGAVRAALETDPTLADASWDWGAGDRETAIGAAGHMGRRDTAELLLAHGARMDIFVAAMLDEVEIVQALLPLQRDARGPHGIPLREHAEAGNAERVLMLLGDDG